jgi:hypothetical protein
VHKIAYWADTSERMILDTYRHELDEISELGPIDVKVSASPRRNATWTEMLHFARSRCYTGAYVVQVWCCPRPLLVF